MTTRSDRHYPSQGQELLPGSDAQKVSRSRWLGVVAILVTLISEKRERVGQCRWRVLVAIVAEVTVKNVALY